MALLTIVFTKIKKLFLVLFSVLKKPFCCRRKSRRNSGMILPMTVDIGHKSCDNLHTFQSNTNSWPQTQANCQLASNAVNASINSHNYHSNDPSFSPNLPQNSIINKNMNPLNEDINEDRDYFKDMVPEFRKPKKILLTANESMDTQKSNRFGVDMKATIFQSRELGVIDHYEDGTGSWEDNAAEEELLDTDQSLKTLRHQEREKRIAEHKRIKAEKEFKRSKQTKGSLLATKIS